MTHASGSDSDMQKFTADTHRSTSASAMPALPKVDLRENAA